MEYEKLIKSKERVKKHGEVFTPKWVVDMMLDQPGIKEATKDLKTTFLEPSAGEGAFLIEILNRRLKLADKMSSSFKEYEENALIGLSTLYGIELLEDNVEMLVMNLISEFEKHYYAVMYKYSDNRNSKVLQSAKVIISTNMVQGNALTHLTSENTPIIFSEWKILAKKYGKYKVERIESTFEDIIEQNSNKSLAPTTQQSEQLDLFTLFDKNKDQEEKNEKFLKLRYKIVNLFDVGQQLVEEVE